MLIFACAPRPGAAQPDSSTWARFTQFNKALPDNLVIDLIAKCSVNTPGSCNDSIWASTVRGIARFDQGGWRTYNASNSRLPENFADQLFKATDGDVWAVLPWHGMARFFNLEWSIYSAKSGNLPKGTIVHAAADRDGSVWIATVGGNIARFDGFRWRSIEGVRDHLPAWNGEIIALAPAEEGTLWAIFHEAGIGRYQDGAWTFFNQASGALPTDSVSALAVFDKGEIWAAFEEADVGRFDGTRWEPFDLPGELARILGQTADGRVWVGAGGAKLYSYDGHWREYVVELQDAMSSKDTKARLHSQTPFLLREIESGAIWIATAEGLIGEVSEGKWRLRDAGTPINTMEEDAAGSLWLGTRSGPMRLTATKLTGINLLTPPIGEPAQPDIRSSVATRDGDMWFGTFNNGLLRYTPSRGHLHLPEKIAREGAVRLHLEIPSGRTMPQDWSIYYRSSPDGKREWSALRTSREVNADLQATLAIPPELGETFFIQAQAVDVDGAVIKFPHQETVGPIPREKSLLASAGDYVSYAAVVGGLFWTFLAVFYPWSPRVQAVFFWNPKARQLLSFWIVDLLIVLLAPARRYLLRPFNDNLLAEARLGLVESYFRDLRVVDIDFPGQEDTPRPIVELLGRLSGQHLIVGRSGSGKTHFVRYLLTNQERSAVFLEARACAGGVVAAILKRLPLQTEDARLIEKLIFLRTLLVVIDGLNEVDADVRGQVYLFLQRFPRADILVTSQPIGWRTPPSMRIHEVQPLMAEQLRSYLLLKLAGNEGARALVESFVSAIAANSDPLVRKVGEEALSVPFDLDLVAELLERGEVPTLYRLQEQYLTLVRNEYEELFLQAIPLGSICQAAYEARQANSNILASGDLGTDTLEFMKDKRILIKRPFDRVVYAFRHDRIQDFFISLHFQSTPDLMSRHLADVRFTGAFVLLAGMLDANGARELLASLAIRAAAQKEHGVIDPFILRLRELGTLELKEADGAPMELAGSSIP